MSFNLDGPPGFRGLNPHKPVRIYTRNIPHWRQDGATYFVTFNLDDALPKPKKNEMAALRRDWELKYPPPRNEAAWTLWAKQSFKKVETWMDAGHGACWFNQTKYADELQRSILHFHGKRYEVGCLTLMANHCHLIIRPFDNVSLEDETGSIKNVTTQFINKHESRSGRLWQQEFYDRIVRDDEHLFRVVRYVGSNPADAGIPPERWRRWMNPSWIAAGWDFAK